MSVWGKSKQVLNARGPMRRTGVRYELVGVAEEKKQKKTGISDYLKSHRLRRQPAFMIRSITIHGWLLWNQQFFL